MRKLIPFVIIVIVLSGFMSVITKQEMNQHVGRERRDILDSLEVLSRFIFECTRANDFKAYATRVPTRAQINELVAMARKADSTTFEGESAEVEQKIDEQFGKIQPGFTETYEDGLGAGIDWKKAVYERTIFDVTNEPGFVMAKIRIFFTHDGSNYELSLRDLVKIGNRWYNFSKMRLDESEAYDFENMDSATVYVDTMPMIPDSVDLR